MRPGQAPELPNALGALTLRASYDAARQDRFRRTRPGMNPLGSGADYHYRNETDFLRVLEYTRDMVRNDTIVGSIVQRSSDNIVQNGFGLDPDTGDRELDAEIREGFTSWAETPALCDAAGRFTLHEMAWLADFARKSDGDCFILPLEDGRLQFVEGHRCRTPTGTTRNVVHGVLLDELRRPEQYWFTRDDIDLRSSLNYVRDVEQINARAPVDRRLAAFGMTEAEQVWHIYDPRRVSQTRGVTAFAAVFRDVEMFGDTRFAQLVKELACACFTFIREKGVMPTFGEKGATGARTTETLSDGSQRLVEQLSPGQEIEGRPGETIKAFSPNVPITDFEHVRFTLQLICVAVNLPLISFLLDGRETNFSGWRGAIDQAKIGWRREQGLLARQFYRRAYVHWLAQRIVGDDAFAQRLLVANKKSRFDPWRITITRPRWPYIQPIQDIEADQRERAFLLTSPRRKAAERGAEWEQIVAETVEDNALAIRTAVQSALRIRNELQVWVDPVRLLNLNTAQPLIQIDPLAPAPPANNQPPPGPPPAEEPA
jgi:capsid protein